MIHRNSAWDAGRIDAFMADQQVPLRLACLTRKGRPTVCSLWYLYEEGVLWCATQATARVASRLTREPHCGFEIAPDAMPYRGVRGQGTAAIVPSRGSEILGRLIDRYLGSRDTDFANWLLGRSDSEVAIRIEPDWLTSWDFSRRMPSRGG